MPLRVDSVIRRCRLDVRFARSGSVLRQLFANAAIAASRVGSAVPARRISPFTGPCAFADAVFAHSTDPRYCAPQGLGGSVGAASTCGLASAGRKSRNDEDDKLSLPTGSSLIEDILRWPRAVS